MPTIQDLFMQALARKKFGDLTNPDAAQAPGTLATYRPQGSILDPRASAIQPTLDRAGALGLDGVRPQDVVQPAFQVPTPPSPQTQWERAVSAPMPTAPQVTTHSGGFGSRLKDALIGTALMGPVGGIASLFNPQLAHNARYNAIDLPRFQQTTAFNQKWQDNQLDQYAKVAGLTGRLPDTLSPTEPTRYRQEQQAQREWYQQQQIQNAQQKDATTRRGQDLGFQGKLLSVRSGQDRQFINNTFQQWAQRRVTLTPQLRQQLMEAGGPGMSQLVNQMQDLAPPQLGTYFTVDDNDNVVSVPFVRNPGPGENPVTTLPSNPTGVTARPRAGDASGAGVSLKEFNAEVRKRVQETIKSELPDLSNDTGEIGTRMFGMIQSGQFQPKTNNITSQLEEFRQWYQQRRNEAAKQLWDRHAKELQQEGWTIRQGKGGTVKSGGASKAAPAPAAGKPDSTGMVPGVTTRTIKGVQYLYKGVNPQTGKLRFVPVGNQ